MADVYFRSGASGSGSGVDWANAKLSLASGVSGSGSGDRIFVAADHNESTAGTVTITLTTGYAIPLRVFCVDHTGSVPPVSADLRTTAVVSTTGANGINITGQGYIYGITFNAGTGGSSAQFVIGSGTTYDLLFDSCALRLGTTTASSQIIFGNTATNSLGSIVLNNTTLQFAHTGQTLNPRNTRLIWKNTTSAITGATVPTSLFLSVTTLGGRVEFEGVDLSAIVTGPIINGTYSSPKDFLFKDCKLASSVAISGTIANRASLDIVVSRCDNGATNYRTERWQHTGTQTTETVIVRTGGATDLTTPISWKVVAVTNTSWHMSFAMLPLAAWNDVSGSNVTVTIEGLQDPRTSVSLPNNDDIWFDIEYLGSSSSPLGTFNSGTKADGLATGSALTASTEAWDSLVTARANSTAYSLGAARKVASNTGRVFICTTAGTSAGSEPGGYASAVDGGSVTDGSAVFKAAVRFKYSATLSSPQPGMKGVLYVYPKVGKASGIYYVDPKIILS